jgi:hypothetical protein
MHRPAPDPSEKDGFPTGGPEAISNVSWHEPIHDLLRRAVAEGRTDQSIASLTELLRKP